jgi:hypothetical protein
MSQDSGSGANCNSRCHGSACHQGRQDAEDGQRGKAPQRAHVIAGPVVQRAREQWAGGLGEYLRDRGIVNDVSILGQLYDDAKPNGFLCNAIFDLVKEEIWTGPGGFGLVEIFIACYRQHTIAPIAARAVCVGKLECGYREKRPPSQSWSESAWEFAQMSKPWDARQETARWHSGCVPAGSVAISALRNSRSPSTVRTGKASTE